MTNAAGLNPSSPPATTGDRLLIRGRMLAVALLIAALAGGCEQAGDVELRREITQLRETIGQKDNELAARQASIDELNQRLATVRSLSEDDLRKIFYPEKLTIDKLTGGADYDGRPGDDGVTVYLKPIDRDGDVVKVAGDIRIQLYDLEAPSGHKLISEYRVPADQVGKLWHGKLLTGHFTVKCPWPGPPPQHPEITVRAMLVDYFTGRVVSAQQTCKVNLSR